MAAAATVAASDDLDTEKGAECADAEQQGAAAAGSAATLLSHIGGVMCLKYFFKIINF